MTLPARTTWLTGFVICTLGFSVVACSSPEERAQAHYQSGVELLQSGDFVKAGLEFRNAIKYNEKFVGAWLGLATVDEKSQDWSELNASLQHVVELDTKNVESLVKLAKLQMAAGKLDDALKYVNSANDLKKNDTDVLALRAAILLKLGDREGARADGEHALALNPDNPDAHAVMAADQILSKNMPGALLFIDRGLAKDPNNLGLLLFKLKIFEETRDDIKLEAVLRQIVVAAPEKKETRQILLDFLVKHNRLGEAETELRALHESNPEDIDVALSLVRVAGAVGGPAAAHTELEGLIAAEPNVIDYQLALAQLNFSEGHTEIATTAVAAIVAKGEPKRDLLRARLVLIDMQTKLGHTDEAMALIKDVLADDANNADALALRANFRLQAGDLDNAVADIREALNQRPNSVPLLLMLGRAHERQGAVDLANDSFVEALKGSNYDPQNTLDYINFLGRRGKSDEIENTLNLALAHNPNDARLLSAMAQIKINKQDWIGAQEIADALKKGGDTAGVSQQIEGALLLGQKKYDEGIATLKDAYSSAQHTQRPMYALVTAYVQAGKISEAESFLQSILTANDKNVDAIVLMGSLMELQKKPQEAEADYKRAIEYQPTNPAGYVALSKFYFMQKNDAQAEAVLRQGRDKAPTDVTINLMLAGALEKKNDTEGAIAIYQEQLKSNPDAPIIINNLASLLADYRTDPASLVTASVLAKRLAAVDVPQFKDTVGWVAYRSGDYQYALQNLEAAVEKLPTMALLKFHLAMTYAALKRDAEAKEQFAKADALTTDGDPLKEKIRLATGQLGTIK